MSTTIMPAAEADTTSRRATQLTVTAHQATAGARFTVTSVVAGAGETPRRTTHPSPDARAAILAHFDHLESER